MISPVLRKFHGSRVLNKVVPISLLRYQPFTFLLRESSIMSHDKVSFAVHDNGEDRDPPNKDPLATKGSKQNKRKSLNSDDCWFSKKKSIVGNERNKGARSSTDTPHAGSYASPEMQKFLGISVVLREESEKNGEDDEDDEDDRDNPNKVDRKIKRKCAFLIGFIGTKYSGFQMNPKALTVQSEFEYALYKAGLIHSFNFGIPHKYSWSVSARTDKGVHACGQVCTSKILLDVDKQQDSGLHYILDLLNSNLPSDIMVLDVIQTSKSFCAKTKRDKVRYQYLVPSFLLCDRINFGQILATTYLYGKEMHQSINWDDEISTPQFKCTLANLRQVFLSYRASGEQLERLSSVLSKFSGTHPFHNYTRGLVGTDANALRYIHSCTLDPTYIDSFGMEWVPICVIGQSFLLNQIRKMISMATNVVRGYCSDGDFEKSLQKDYKMKTDIAPPNGLYLDMSFYETYNRKSKPSVELKWTEEGTPAVHRWKEFKKRIMNHISNEEEQEMNFIQYLLFQEFNCGKGENNSNVITHNDDE